jgi:hypothetical protein
MYVNSVFVLTNGLTGSQTTLTLLAQHTNTTF